jgi:hypothetical protein
MPRLPALVLLLVLALGGSGCAEGEQEIEALRAVVETQEGELARQRETIDSLQALVRAKAPLAQPRDWPADPEALTYAPYRNERFGYTVEYPDQLFRPDGMIGDGNGQAFVSDDRTATLLVYATEEAAEGSAATLRRQYENELVRADQRITYRRLQPDWFVVSGHEGDDIFYQRTERTSGGLRTFRLRHHAADEDYFAPVTRRLSYAFAEAPR